MTDIEQKVNMLTMECMKVIGAYQQRKFNAQFTMTALQMDNVCNLMQNCGMLMQELLNELKNKNEKKPDPMQQLMGGM